MNDISFLTQDDRRRSTVTNMAAARKYSKITITPSATRLFENEQEAILFRTLTLIRHSPEWAMPHVKRLRSHKKYTGANLDIVVKRLRQV